MILHKQVEFCFITKKVWRTYDLRSDLKNNGDGQILNGMEIGVVVPE